SGLSGGAIVGIAIGGVAFLAALAGALFLFKRRRNRKNIDNTLDNLFNTVNLDMQENHHHHPRNDFPPPPPTGPSPLRNNDRFNNIADDLPGHLNSAMMGANGISAAGGRDDMYPYESHQYYPGHQDVDDNGVSYMPPMEPVYGHYNDGRYGHYDAEYMTPEQQDQETAYYQEQLYQQQLQHERELHAPVTYYNPRRRSNAHYPEQGYAEDAIQQEHLYGLQQQQQQQQQQQHRSRNEDTVPVDFPVLPSGHHPLRGDIAGRSAVSSIVATPRPGSGSEAETVRHSVISDGKIGVDNSKSEPWPDSRDSITSSSSITEPHSPKRNPQLIVKSAANE
ncbi:hypothetical protein BGZ80_007336, partial [Entomortierella chlamydospora]